MGEVGERKGAINGNGRSTSPVAQSVGALSPPTPPPYTHPTHTPKRLSVHSWSGHKIKPATLEYQGDTLTNYTTVPGQG